MGGFNPHDPLVPRLQKVIDTLEFWESNSEEVDTIKETIAMLEDRLVYDKSSGLLKLPAHTPKENIHYSKNIEDIVMTNYVTLSITLTDKERDEVMEHLENAPAHLSIEEFAKQCVMSVVKNKIDLTTGEKER